MNSLLTLFIWAQDILDDEDSAGSLKDFIDDSERSTTCDSNTSNDDDDTESGNEKDGNTKKAVSHKRVTRAAIAANSMCLVTISHNFIMC